MAQSFADARAARIAREAADWHTRMLEPVPPGERARFEAWHADPAHARAYAEVAQLAALAQGLPRPVRRDRRSPRPGLRALRPVLAFGFIGLLLTFGLLLTTLRSGDAAQAALTNPGPALRLVRLQDGSTVALDTGSRLTISFANGNRAATLLAGRARFDIKPGARPFLLSAKDTRVATEQARLDVSVQDKGARIALHQGHARVASGPGAPATALAPQQAFTIDGSHLEAAQLSSDDRSWPLARIAFDRMPLSDVIARANAVGGVPIRLGPGIASLPVTGVLDLRDTRKLARQLAAALGLALRDREGMLLLTR